MFNLMSLCSHACSYLLPPLLLMPSTMIGWALNLTPWPSVFDPSASMAAQEDDGQQPLDEAGLEEFLVAHLPKPGEINYRVDLHQGKVVHAVITKFSKLLSGMRNVRSHYAQSVLSAIVMKVLVKKESDWHLADEKYQYAEEVSKQLRRMLRDIIQGLGK